MKKVLVVDDTKNIRMILTKCLELEGYEVSAANDGKQALEMLLANPYDLAFLDIKLPEIRGTEILRRIRQHGIRTPVVIITAYATVKNAVECTNMGAVAYVQKPFSAEKIRSVLKELNIYPVGNAPDESEEKLLTEIKVLLEKKDFDHALELSKKVLTNNLETPEVYLLISRIYEGMNREKDAERFYQLYKTYN